MVVKRQVLVEGGKRDDGAVEGSQKIKKNIVLPLAKLSNLQGGKVIDGEPEGALGSARLPKDAINSSASPTRRQLEFPQKQIQKGYTYQNKILSQRSRHSNKAKIIQNVDGVTTVVSGGLRSDDMKQFSFSKGLSGGPLNQDPTLTVSDLQIQSYNNTGRLPGDTQQRPLPPSFIKSEILINASNFDKNKQLERTAISVTSAGEALSPSSQLNQTVSNFQKGNANQFQQQNIFSNTNTSSMFTPLAANNEWNSNGFGDASVTQGTFSNPRQVRHSVVNGQSRGQQIQTSVGQSRKEAGSVVSPLSVAQSQNLFQSSNFARNNFNQYPPIGFTSHTQKRRYQQARQAQVTKSSQISKNDNNGIKMHPTSRPLASQPPVRFFCARNSLPSHFSTKPQDHLAHTKIADTNNDIWLRYRKQLNPKRIGAFGALRGSLGVSEETQQALIFSKNQAHCPVASQVTRSSHGLPSGHEYQAHFQSSHLRSSLGAFSNQKTAKARNSVSQGVKQVSRAKAREDRTQRVRKNGGQPDGALDDFLDEGNSFIQLDQIEQQELNNLMEIKLDQPLHSMEMKQKYDKSGEKQELEHENEGETESKQPPVDDSMDNNQAFLMGIIVKPLDKKKSGSALGYPEPSGDNNHISDEKPPATDDGQIKGKSNKQQDVSRTHNSSSVVRNIVDQAPIPAIKQSGSDLKGEGSAPTSPIVADSSSMKNIIIQQSLKRIAEIGSNAQSRQTTQGGNPIDSFTDALITQTGETRNKQLLDKNNVLPEHGTVTFAQTPAEDEKGVSEEFQNVQEKVSDCKKDASPQDNPENSKLNPKITKLPGTQPLNLVSPPYFMRASGNHRHGHRYSLSLHHIDKKQDQLGAVAFGSGAAHRRGIGAGHLSFKIPSGPGKRQGAGGSLRQLQGLLGGSSRSRRGKEINQDLVFDCDGGMFSKRNGCHCCTNQKAGKAGSYSLISKAAKNCPRDGCQAANLHSSGGKKQKPHIKKKSPDRSQKSGSLSGGSHLNKSSGKNKLDGGKESQWSGKTQGKDWKIEEGFCDYLGFERRVGQEECRHGMDVSALVQNTQSNDPLTVLANQHPQAQQISLFPQCPNPDCPLPSETTFDKLIKLQRQMNAEEKLRQSQVLQSRQEVRADGGGSEVLGYGVLQQIDTILDNGGATGADQLGRGENSQMHQSVAPGMQDSLFQSQHHKPQHQQHPETMDYSHELSSLSQVNQAQCPPKTRQQRHSIITGSGGSLSHFLGGSSTNQRISRDNRPLVKPRNIQMEQFGFSKKPTVSQKRALQFSKNYYQEAKRAFEKLDRQRLVLEGRSASPTLSQHSPSFNPTISIVDDYTTTPVPLPNSNNTTFTYADGTAPTPPTFSTTTIRKHAPSDTNPFTTTSAAKLQVPGASNDMIEEMCAYAEREMRQRVREGQCRGLRALQSRKFMSDAVRSLGRDVKKVQQILQCNPANPEHFEKQISKYEKHDDLKWLVASFVQQEASVASAQSGVFSPQMNSRNTPICGSMNLTTSCFNARGLESHNGPATVNQMNSDTLFSPSSSVPNVTDKPVGELGQGNGRWHQRASCDDSVGQNAIQISHHAGEINSDYGQVPASQNYQQQLAYILQKYDYGRLAQIIDRKGSVDSSQHSSDLLGHILLPDITARKRRLKRLEGMVARGQARGTKVVEHGQSQQVDATVSPSRNHLNQKFSSHGDQKSRVQKLVERLCGGGGDGVEKRVRNKEGVGLTEGAREVVRDVVGGILQNAAEK